MPVPKTGALPLGDSPIPVSGPAVGQENRRASPECQKVLGPRERGAREDLPAARGTQNLAGTPRFPLAVKDSEDARTAARKHCPTRARAQKRVARARRQRLQPREDGLEIVRRRLTERTGKSGLCARNRQVNDHLILCQGGSAERLISLRRRDPRGRRDDDQVHLRRVFERSYRRPRARPQSRPARQKKGHVSAETRADFRQLALARLNFPEARERDERERGVGRTAAESAARGYPLFQSDARAARRAVAFAQSERGTQDEVSFVGRDFGVGAGEFEVVALARLEGQFVV